MKQNLLKICFLGGGGLQSLRCINSIFVFVQVAKNEYSLYSYLVYSVFVFGQVTRNEYIRYSYSGKVSFTNIFVFVFGQEFDIRVTLHEE